MADAAPRADFVITATGCADVIDGRHVPLLKDGCVLANAGHFNNEISIPALSKAAKSIATVRAGVTAYTQKDGRVLHLLSDGRLVNLASGQGHPVEIMDLTFGVQALAARHLLLHGAELEPRVHLLPAEIDEGIARRKLEAPLSN